MRLLDEFWNAEAAPVRPLQPLSYNRPFLDTRLRAPRGSSRPSGAGARSEQRLAAGGGTAQAAAWWLGGRGGLERGLDGVGDELRGLRVDGDVPAEQHAADDLPGVPWPDDLLGGDERDAGWGADDEYERVR